MKLVDLIEHYARALRAERDRASAQGLDAPVLVTGGRRLSTSGTIHLYELDVATEARLTDDLPITLIPSSEMEPTEGFVVGRRAQSVLLQTFDAFGPTVGAATIVPDAIGFFETALQRLAEMAAKPQAYSLGPAERLLPWLDPDQPETGPAIHAVSTAVLSTLWEEDRAARLTKLATAVLEVVRGNKKLLLISPTHQSSDETLGAIARAMRGASLPFKSLLCRYEMPVLGDAAGMPLAELGFEAQMHQFYARSRADKASLRRQYERFRELTPILAYKAEKQRDLNEVKLLEWRLLTQLSDLQAKIKDIDETLAGYEQIPIWKRLAMQAAGKNVATLRDYRSIHEQTIQNLMRELEAAKHRIEALSPEAAIPKEMRPEYDELKEEITRLGGTKKIRELLAAEEGTNRQAFIQNKRVVATTAARVISDPLFSRVRFDVLIADDAFRIPPAYLLAAAGLARERIVLSGDLRDRAA
ncbi:MAG: AAA domain-containing protein, partial [Nitrospiraceae bacterium]